jgi:hypothetical protein
LLFWLFVWHGITGYSNLVIWYKTNQKSPEKIYSIKLLLIFGTVFWL